jgi:NADH:ubiquinone oxidoreductase subunit F (NADH-binding)
MATLVSHPDEVKVISKRFGQGATNIDRYLELDGYKAVQKAITMTPEAIVNEVKNSGLRGRGGAGFSTGMKWSFVPKESAKPKYVLCNGDESEPGTCKDRLIFEHDPHAVIEGVMIAALAVGAKTGYIYVRGEYRYLLVIMQKAIKDAYAKGFLGKNIFGSGRDLDIYWHGSLNRSKASAASHAFGLLFRRLSAFGADRPSSITRRRWRRCHTFSWAARIGIPGSARQRMAARDSSASLET